MVECELTLAEVPEEHVEEGDVDWLMTAAMLLDLTQDQLTGSRKYCSLRVRLASLTR